MLVNGQPAKATPSRWLDMMRGSAALAVLAYHWHPGYFRGGYLGVDVFFVLSGFLITKSLLSKEAEVGLRAYAIFYERRVLRIVPGIVWLSGVILFYGWFRLPSFGLLELAHEIRAAIEYRLNFALAGEAGYFNARAKSLPLIHLWSICLEMQVYLVWPVILLIPLKLSKRARLWIMAVVALGSLGVEMTIYRSGLDKAFFLPWTRIWEFAVGGALSLGGWQLKFRWGAPFFIASLIMLTVVAPDYANWTTQLTATGLTSFFIMVDVSDESLRGAYLWIAWIGFYSYEFYLWHYPILWVTRGRTFLTGLMLAGVGIALGFVPATRMRLWDRQRTKSNRMRRYILWGLVLLILIVRLEARGLENSAGAPWRSASSGLPREAFTLGPTRIHRCFLVSEDLKTGYCPECIQSKTAIPNVLLFGDSHAAMLYPALQADAGPWNFQLAQLDLAGCPPDVLFGSFGWKGCSSNNENVLRMVKSHGIEVAIVAANWVLYDHDVALETSPDVATQNDFGRNTWPLSGLGVMIERLRKRGVRKVIVLGQFPYYEDDVSRHVGEPIMRSLRLTKALVRACYRTDDAVRKEALRAGATFVSPMAFFCDAKGCRVTSSSTIPVPWVLDHSHLTAAGANYFENVALRPALMSAFRGLSIHSKQRHGYSAPPSKLGVCQRGR